MKIIINENEIYEIKLPETINADGFLELLNQFDNIVKLVRLNSISKDFKDSERIRVKRTYNSWIKIPFFDAREKVLDLLQYAYCGTKEDKCRIEKVMNRKWNHINKRFSGLIERYNIKPNEIGLIRFRKSGEGRGRTRNSFILPNYVIKSYTGIFDKNGN